MHGLQRLVGIVLVATAPVAAADTYALLLDGEHDLPFTASYRLLDVDGDDTVATIEGVTPYRAEFEADGLVVLVRSNGGAGRLSGAIHGNGRRISQASASGSGAAIMLRAGHTSR